MKGILQYVETMQLKWYGHVKRMPDDRLPDRLLNWNLTTSRLPGRPQMQRMDNLKVAVEMKKRVREMQTLCAGCSKTESKNFAPPQTPSRGRGTAKM